MTDFYLQVSRECSRLITRRYSTSFSSAIGLLAAEMRLPVCSIYGFVRLADEIVDSFHEQDKAARLAEFTADTWRSIEERFSLNPVLHAYQDVVNQYNIPAALTQAFLHSMAMDLQKTTYANAGELDEYIYGSAEVVGLMCLCIFVAGDKAQYEHLKEPARRLGAAFQKIKLPARSAGPIMRACTAATSRGLTLNILTGRQRALLKMILPPTLKPVPRALPNYPTAHDWGCTLPTGTICRFSSAYRPRRPRKYCSAAYGCPMAKSCLL